MTEEKLVKNQKGVPAGCVRVRKQKWAYKDDLDHAVHTLSYEINRLKELYLNLKIEIDKIKKS